MKSEVESVGFSADGATLRCDGSDCTATASVPVGLGVGTRKDHVGWLFVSGTAGTRHYCPNCALAVLKTADDKTD